MKHVALLLLVAFAFVSCGRLLPTQIFPYSMVKFQENYFVDQTEITVEQYAEFVYDGNQSHKPQADAIQNFRYVHLFYPTETPDSMYRALGKIGYYELPVVREYFDTLRYKELREILDFPITGINYDDALAYADWRTRKYNAQNTTHTKQVITFVLPNALVYEKEEPKKNRKKPLPENSLYRVNTKYANQNQYEVYGLHSNASEMTNEEGLAYGFANEKEVAYFAYSEPQPNLGFRCVGIVSE